MASPAELHGSIRQGPVDSCISESGRVRGGSEGRAGAKEGARPTVDL